MLLKKWELAIILAIVTLTSFFLPLELSLFLLFGATAFYFFIQNYYFVLLAKLFVAYVALGVFDFFRFFRLPTQLLWLILAYAFAKIYLINKEEKLFLPSQFFAFVGFSLTVMLSAAFNGDNPIYAVLTITYLDYILIAFFIIYLTKNLKTAKNLFWLLSIAVIFFAVVSWGEGRPFETGNSLIENRNNLAMHIAPIIPLIFALLILNTEKIKKFGELLKKCFLLGAFFTGLIAVFLTLSRGTIIGVITSFVALFCFFPNKKIWPAIAIVCILAVPFFYSSIPKMLERTSELEKIVSTKSSSQELKNSSVLERRDVFIDTIKIFLKNPFIGVGIGNSAQLLGTKYKTFNEYVGKYLDTKDPHNVYAKILAETGIIGFFFYLAIIVFTFFDLSNAQKSFAQKNCNEGVIIAKCLKASLIGVIVTNFFANELFSLFFMLLVGIAIALNQIAINLNSTKTV